MNTYYELIQYLKNLFESDNRVNNVVTGDFEQWAKDMFLLVHIDVTDSPYIEANTTALSRFNITINVLDIRDVNKQDIKDRFWFNDTRHDSWNDTYSVMKLARDKCIKDYLRNDITLVSSTGAERITYAYMNGLDGWSETWTVDVPDNFTAVC
jgi:hypothetical protein